MTAIESTEDGADESIVPSKVTKRAVLNRIEKMSKVDTVRLPVALKYTPKA